ncbi:phospholipid scramblase-related protein [Acanthopleuribacter pedis]|uniref:Scramblase n=1 Tax=Acanthopleuribacter pedis TaxID=442870 RepID=A0A8J7U2Q3_9BACT|nr:phospholipid scramblase-related protein [Acanthopleuribacter pedis]MBO1319563.1 hypothetical protein [Acanthopleuribacter pedis]
MDCPKCGFTTENGALDCPACGVVFSKLAGRGERPKAAPVTRENHDWDAYDPALHYVVGQHDHLFIQQHARHWWEILLNWEQTNTYHIQAPGSRQIGYIEELNVSFMRTLSRLFLGSHRPLDVAVVTGNTQVLELRRAFFFFFSHLKVMTPRGTELGEVQRRLGILNRRYDLIDEHGHVFAIIRSPLLRIWTFHIYDAEDRKVGMISKKWGGLLKEAFTDADNFLIDFGETNWTPAQRAVIFATAISIDFDFFENNHQS